MLSAYPHMVWREALVETLLHRQPRLTLIHAAAGYGKSTLLRQWGKAEAEAGQKVIWVNLDSRHTDPSQFVSAVAAAFLLEHPSLETSVQGIIRGSPRLTSDQSLKILSQALCSASERTLLILDDYNAAQSSEIERLTDVMLHSLPEHVRMVIASRKRPRLSLAPLMAGGDLLEVSADDLRLDIDDLREIFRDLLDDHALQDLLSRTQGWGIALQMARVLIANSKDPSDFIRHFTGSIQDISDYLANHVFSSLSRPCQDFLVDTCFLERVGCDLADFIRDRTDSALFLDELKSIQAFFIPHDTPEQTWYLHHPMFNEFLWSRFALKDQEAVRILYHRAAEWYWRHDHIIDAIRYARKAEDLDLVVKIFQASGGATIGLNQGVNKLQQIINLLPDKWIFQTPCLLLARALVLAKEGRLRECYECIDNVKASVREPADPGIKRDILFSRLLVQAYADDAVSAQEIAATERLFSEIPLSDYWFRGWVNNVLCMLHFRHGNLTAAHSAGLNAMANYRDADAKYTQFFAFLHIGFVEFIKGASAEAFRAYRRAERIAAEHFHRDPAMLALARLMMANIYYERNYLERSDRLLRDALPLVESYEGWTEIFISGYLTAASVAYRRKGLSAAFAILDRAEETAHARKLPRIYWRAVCKKVELLTVDGNADLAADLSASLSLAQLLNSGDGGSPSPDQRSVNWDERQAAAIALARLAIHRGDAHRAFEIFECQAHDSEAMSRPAYLLKQQLLLSVADLEMGGTDAAISRLAKLMAHPLRRNFRRLLLDEGEKTSRLFRACHEAMPEGNRDAEVCLKHLADDRMLSAAYGKCSESYYLTTREQEILREIDLGRSSKMIASNLNLTERTIKFHLQNIYMKFGVNSRTKALYIARKHRLLQAVGSWRSGVT